MSPENENIAMFSKQRSDVQGVSPHHEQGQCESLEGGRRMGEWSRLCLLLEKALPRDFLEHCDSCVQAKETLAVAERSLCRFEALVGEAVHEALLRYERQENMILKARSRHKVVVSATEEAGRGLGLEKKVQHARAELVKREALRNERLDQLLEQPTEEFSHLLPVLQRFLRERLEAASSVDSVKVEIKEATHLLREGQFSPEELILARLLFEQAEETKRTVSKGPPRLEEEHFPPLGHRLQRT